MEELNTMQSVEVIDQDKFDTLTVVDMGEAISLSQVAEDGKLETVVIGTDQAEKLARLLMRFLG
jgi:hypothetical protein